MPRPRFGPLRDVFNGIVAVSMKELRGRMRGRRAFLIMTIYLALLGAYTWMMSVSGERTVEGGFGGAFSAAAQIGRELFVALLMLQTILVLILAPAATAGAISQEREKQTLDLLVSTPVSSLAIVTGKLLSALTYLLLLVVASIPLTALVFTFGGVAPGDLLRGYAVLIVTALGLGTVGLFASALVRRTQGATVLTYVLVVAATLGATFVYDFANGARGGFGVLPATERVNLVEGRPPEALMYFNPFVAQADVICGTETGFGFFCSIIGNVTNQPAVGFNDVPVKAGPEGVAPDVPRGGIAADIAPVQFGIPRDGYWPRSLAAWIVLSIVLIVISVQLVSPTRRWRIRLPRARRRPQGETPDADA